MSFSQSSLYIVTRHYRQFLLLNLIEELTWNCNTEILRSDTPSSAVMSLMHSSIKESYSYASPLINYSLILIYLFALAFSALHVFV